MIKLPTNLGDTSPEINIDIAVESGQEDLFDDSDELKSSSKEIRWRKDNDK